MNESNFVPGVDDLKEKLFSLRDSSHSIPLEKSRSPVSVTHLPETRGKHPDAAKRTERW